MEFWEYVKVVDFNTYVTIRYDGELVDEVVKIVPAIITYDVVWEGSRSYNSRETKAVANVGGGNLDKGEISSESPLAKVLLGKKVGNTFSYKVGNFVNSGIIKEIKKAVKIKEHS